MGNIAQEKIGKNFKFLFVDHGFRYTQENIENSGFTSLIEAISPSLHIRFIIDRDHPYVDIGPAGSNIWCSLNSIYTLFMGHWAIDENPYNKMEDLSRFLRDNFRYVEACFQESKVKQTIADIENIEDEWRKTYFGKK